MKLKIYKSTGLKENVDDDIAQINGFFKSDFVKSIIPGGIDITYDVEWTSVIKQDAILKLMKPLEGKYDFVMYLYERPITSTDFFGLTFMVSPKLVGIYQGVDPYDDAQSYIWKSICHELLHAITDKIASEKCIVLQNYLDYPLKNGKVDMSVYVAGNQNPYMIDGNFYQQFKAVAPYMSTPRVTLTRNSDNGIETLGTINYENFRCLTLERPWKNNQKNISCLPKGTYECRYTFSPKFLKYTYELQNTSPRSGIRIHSANYFFDLQGCIALGDSYGDINKDGQRDILNSRATIKRFEQLLNYKPFTLVIQ